MNLPNDRLIFSTTRLANGHYLHSHPCESTLTELHVVTQIGNAHAHPSNQQFDLGVVHFLEHMCFERSEKHPENTTYTDVLQASGAYQNAVTHDVCTDFYLTTPAHTFSKVINDFLDHIVHPIFHQSDIDLQREIIKNERAQQKFFPGIDAITQYQRTEWMNSTTVPKEQVFGSNQSLDAITPTVLNNVHDYYFAKPLHIFIGGSYDLTKVTNTLESLPPVNPSLSQPAVETQRPTWKHQAFHQFSSTDAGSFILELGSFATTYTVSELWSVSFILELLTDGDTGTLQKWIRHEKGWSYGVESNLEFRHNFILWHLSIPVNSVGRADEIRLAIHERIHTAIQDETIVARAKQKQELQFCFSFETLSSRMEYAVLIHDALGEIPTEHDYITWLRAVTPESLGPVYEKYFAPRVVGELLVTPAG